MPFRIGLSGLNAASADLEVTGNNIANAGTTGFKGSRAEFADVFADSYGSIAKTAIGSGVRLESVSQQFGQGNIDFTDNALDLAINGEGFFVLNDDGEQLYTRAGAFQVDRDGFLVNTAGQRLQAYPPLEEGSANPTFNTGDLADVQLDFGDNPPRPTGEVLADINLSSEAEQIVDDTGTAVPFDVTDPDTYGYSTSLTIYDSLGTPRNLTMYFVKGATAGTWDAYAELGGSTLSPPTPVGPFALTFDSNGIMSAPTAPTDIAFTMTDYAPDNGGLLGPIDPATGEATGTFTLDFTKITQYGAKYSVSDLNQDGYTTGRLAGFDVDQSGVIFARYTNGQAAALGQVALANFANPQGLQQLGNNNWADAYAAGEVVLGTPGTSNLGLVQSGGLEASNVDLAAQLVNLIIAQRNYQANAQTISTADEVTQTIINIR